MIQNNTVTDVQTMMSVRNAADILRGLDNIGVTWPQIPFEPNLAKITNEWGSLRGRIILFKKNDSYRLSNVVTDEDGNELIIEYEPYLAVGIDQNGQLVAIAANPLRDQDIIRQLGFEYELVPESQDIDTSSLLTRINRRLRYPDTINGKIIKTEYLQRAIKYQVQKTFHPSKKLAPVKHLGPPTWPLVYIPEPLRQDFTAEDTIRATYVNLLIGEIMEHAAHNGKITLHLTGDMAAFFKNILSQKNVWHRPETRKKRPNDQDFSENYTQDVTLAPNTEKIWSVITNVGAPDICRYADNPNKNSFDYIELRFGIRQYADPEERTRDVKTCIKDMVKMGLQKIKNHRSFKRYGVPLSFLRCERYVITAQSEVVLHYTLRTETSESNRKVTTEPC